MQSQIPAMPSGTTEADRLLNADEVSLLYGGLSPATLWRWEADGRFPKRIVLSGGKVRWLLSAIREHQRQLAAGEIAPPASYRRPRGRHLKAHAAQVGAP